MGWGCRRGRDRGRGGDFRDEIKRNLYCEFMKNSP